MSQTVIIYGPQACGKTINAEALRAAYGCTSIRDDGELDGNRRVPIDPNSGELWLTNNPRVLRHFPLMAVHFDEAIKRVANPRIVVA